MSYRYSEDKVTEDGFCVEYVACVQSALKSHVSPKCGVEIESKN